VKRGPKPQMPQVKAARGTLRKDRDGASGMGAVTLIMAGDPPVMPDYLLPAAREIWIEELSRVMLAGVSEADSSLFATYCSTEALARSAFQAGEPPPAAYLTELRRMRELLGIAGPRARIPGKAAAGGQSDNPFARNGRTTRAV
jgi:hypothetical protein